VVLELVLRKDLQATIVLALLIFNAGLSFVQSSCVHATLAAVKSRLALHASARREGAWSDVLAAFLVCEDIIEDLLGGVVPADALITSGNVLQRRRSGWRGRVSC